MNILRTFDIFWTLPEKLFGKKFFKVLHVETGNDSDTKSINTETTEDEVCINVYNSPKVYSLLTSVLYKKKLLNENKVGKIYKECSNA